MRAAGTKLGFLLAMAPALVQLAGCDSILGLDSLKDRAADRGDGASEGATEGAPDATTDDGPEGYVAPDAPSDASRWSDGEASDDATSESAGPDAEGVEASDEGSIGASVEASADAGADALIEACVPLSMAAVCGNTCGTVVSDGCDGGTTSCACAAPQTCGGGGTAGECGDPNPGCAPASRYTVVDLGDGGGGTGLVYDSTTQLTWMRLQLHDPNINAESVALYDCTNLGMTLPTLAQAEGISGSATDSCAWPAGWDTWTSTPASLYGNEDVGAGGNVGVAYMSNYQDVLCVSTVFP